MANGKDDASQNVSQLRSDRRKNLRKQLLVLKIKGEDAKGVFFGYAKTLSRGGMFITTITPKQTGEQFKISFTMTGDPVQIECVCEVVWAREYDPKLKQEPGMGIKFLNLDEATTKRIARWVENNQGSSD